MATVEYTALAILVSIALVVAGVAADGREIGATIVAQVHKAYCIVEGGDCYARGGPRPCVVGWRSKETENSAKIVVVRLRDGRRVRLEELSDGTFRVSLSLSSGGGAGVQIGVEVKNLFGRTVDADVDAEAGLDVAYGKTYVVADAAAAKRLMKRLEDEGPPAGGVVPGIADFVRDGDGDEAERSVAVSSRLEAQAALEALGLGPRVGALAGMTGALTLDRRSGDATLGLKLDREVQASLGVALAEASAGAVRSAEVQLVLDRRRRPRELVVRGVGSVHAEAKLQSGGAAMGDLFEAQARLDLTDPELGRLVDRMLGGDVGAVRALGGHVQQQARIDIRHFTTTRDEDSTGGDAFGTGFEHARLSETARLVSAEGRDPGMPWRRRLDCVSPSAA